MKLFVTGFKGMLGSAILRTKNKYSIVKVDFPTDLRDFEQVKKCFSNLQPDYVIHTAAKVGGVKINSEHLGEFYLDNILINTNILEASRIYKVKKVWRTGGSDFLSDSDKYNCDLIFNKIEQPAGGGE